MLRTAIFLIAALLVPCLGCEKPKVVAPSGDNFNKTDVIPDAEVSSSPGGGSAGSDAPTQKNEVVPPPDF